MLEKKVCVVCNCVYAPMSIRQRFCRPGCREKYTAENELAKWVNKPAKKIQKSGFRSFPLTAKLKQEIP